MCEARRPDPDPEEGEELGVGSEMLHMQEMPRLEEEAADFAWDVAPLEPPAAVQAVTSGYPRRGQWAP